MLPDDDPEDRLGIDAVLALKMKWLVVNHERSYSLGPRLLLHYPKYPVVADQTWGKAFVVNGNVLFLAYLYNWRFVHLNDSFDEVTGWNGSPGYQPYTRPVHLYCNVGESSIVGNQITNFLRIKTNPPGGNRNTCSITGWAGTRWRLWKWKCPVRTEPC